MKHAGANSLDILEPLLSKIREYAALKERKRGLFYLKGKSFLHFHEDPAGLFADLCAKGQDVRLRVNAPTEQRVLLSMIKDILSI